MANDEELNAEQKIIDSAADVFEEKGLAGARMQQIADRAGINKALLHYYFRSKDKLFEKVFLIVGQRAFKKFAEVLDTGETVFEKIESFFVLHQDLLWKNRNFPIFFINEVNQNPNLVKKVFEKIEISGKWTVLIDQINLEKEQGIIRSDVDPIHLLVNILSLSIFPYIGKPILKELMNNVHTDYEKFLSDHRIMVSSFVINSIKA